MRQHNRIAAALKEMNPSWNGERIFQESRQIYFKLIELIIC